jgi:nicotinamidase-related amidase
MLALLVVDMNHAFVDLGSPLCVAGARATIPRIRAVAHACRSAGFPVVFVTRGYRPDGSDVEVSRWPFWRANGRPASLDSRGAASPGFCDGLRPRPGDYALVKKRWSAFFRTELDLLLRRLGVDTVAIAGTQTPNCVRATAFDADAHDFATVVLSDCVSAASPGVQESNLADLRRVGFDVVDSRAFLSRLATYAGPNPEVVAIARAVRASRPGRRTRAE